MKKPFKLLIIFLAICSPIFSIAAQWQLAGKATDSEFFLDKAGVTGPNTARLILVKRNILQSDRGPHSYEYKYEINCATNESTLLSGRVYKSLDLEGEEGRATFANLNKTMPIQPNSIGSHFAKVACVTEAAPAPSTPKPIATIDAANQFLQPWIDKANSGDLPAMNMLGNIYKNGQNGVPKDALSAKTWWEKAANKGYGPSYFNLGILYEEGSDVIPKDIEKAKGYYQKAVNLGFAKASERLASLTTASRDLKPSISTKADNSYTNNLTPNISVTTGLPKYPGRPSSATYEMMQINGESSSTGKIAVQIFSDGQASVMSNNSAKFFMHTGNGIFINGENKVIIDEKNFQVSIDGALVKGVKITKNQPPSEDRPYGAKLNFGGILHTAKDEVDLKAGCAAAGIIVNSRQWADRNALEQAGFFGSCVSMSMQSDKNFLDKFFKWKEKMKNVDTYLLLIATDRCQRDYTVSFTFKRVAGGDTIKQCLDVSTNH